MPLAIFDMDNTLLKGDSDYAWGQFACEIGIVARDEFARDNDRFYADYLRGELDMSAWVRFALSPLVGQDPEQLASWQAQFVEQKIKPLLQDKAAELVEQHRSSGDTLLIITATNRFVAAPIANLLGIPHLLASEGEVRDGRYTGEPSGVLCYREGKNTRLQDWLEGRQETLAGSYFYSDSHNDLPLLRAVEHPVAVDPDDILRREALERNWPIISLRD